MSLFLSVDFGIAGAVDTAGTRPYTGTNPLWNNVSIFMEGGPSQTQTRVGTDTTVKVRVSNAGSSAIEDVHVDAYVMNPFVGPFQPFNARRHLSGFAASLAPGSGSTSATDGHVVTCKIQDPNLGPIPWTPTDDDIKDTTDGHMCLVANAYSVPDGGPVPDTTTFDVANDAHQGQRNIAVLQSLSPHIKFQVFGAGEGQEFALDIQQLHASDLGAGERWLLRSLRNVTIPEGSGGRLVLGGTKTLEATPIAFSRKAIRGVLTLDGLGELDLHELAGVGRRVTTTHAQRDPAGRRPAREALEWGPGRLVTSVAPGSSTFATVALDRSDSRGSLQALDVVARDAAGRIFGGLRVLSLQH